MIVLSSRFEDHEVLAAIFAGTRAVLLKHEPPETVKAAIEFVLTGGVAFSAPIVAAITAKARDVGGESHPLEVAGRQLSERETRVFQLIAQGRTDQEIAFELVISPRTVQQHVGNVLNKLGCRSRSEAVAKIAKSLLLLTSSVQLNDLITIL